MKANIKLAKHKTHKDLNATFTQNELEMMNELHRINQREHIIGEIAEKNVYDYLKEAVKNDEVIVINNFKIMKLSELDDIAEDFEKDFIMFNLTRRIFVGLEVKATCNDKNLKEAGKQVEGSKNLISELCGADLSEENGWTFLSVIYFQENPHKFTFCEKCAKYIIIGIH